MTTDKVYGTPGYYPEVDHTRVGYGNVRRGLRVKSADYGTGTVVAILGIGVQVFWDADLAAAEGDEGETHLQIHDVGLIEDLEQL